jgi:phage-related minor tail protein
MPLRRGADGKLGVAAGGAGGGNTQVIINNQSGGQVETQERQDPNGTKIIEVLIKKVMGDSIGRGDFDKTFGSTYGLRRQGAR